MNMESIALKSTLSYNSEHKMHLNIKYDPKHKENTYVMNIVNDENIHLESGD